MRVIAPVVVLSVPEVSWIPCAAPVGAEAGLAVAVIATAPAAVIEAPALNPTEPLPVPAWIEDVAVMAPDVVNAAPILTPWLVPPLPP